MEDGTAPDMKAEGLENTIEKVPEYDFPGEIWPRVEWSYEDEEYCDKGRNQIDRLVGEIGDEIDGVVVPKVGRPRGRETRRRGRRRSRGRTRLRRRFDRPLDHYRDRPRPVGSARDFQVRRGLPTHCARLRARRLRRRELGGRDLGDGMPRWDGLLEALSNESSAADLLRSAVPSMTCSKSAPA